MSFNWEQYIQLADVLISVHNKSNIGEACLRSAMSRSYYGVFCIARNFLCGQGTKIRKRDTHKFVREEYLSSSDKEKRIVGINLYSLWKDRKDADYSNKANVYFGRARTTYLTALKTLEGLKKIGAI